MIYTTPTQWIYASPPRIVGEKWTPTTIPFSYQLPEPCTVRRLVINQSQNYALFVTRVYLADESGKPLEGSEPAFIGQGLYSHVLERMDLCMPVRAGQRIEAHVANLMMMAVDIGVAFITGAPMPPNPYLERGRVCE